MDPLSLNYCLKTGPNMIPDILVKFRWQLVALSADIEQAFLMISIAPQDREVLCFVWFKNPHDVDGEVDKLRFVRLVFELCSFPGSIYYVIQQCWRSRSSLNCSVWAWCENVSEWWSAFIYSSDFDIRIGVVCLQWCNKGRWWWQDTAILQISYLNQVDASTTVKKLCF